MRQFTCTIRNELDQLSRNFDMYTIISTDI